MRCKGWEVIAIDPLTRVTTSDQNLSKKQRNDPTHNVKKKVEPSPCWNQINHLIPIRANVEDVLIECDIHVGKIRLSINDGRCIFYLVIVVLWNITLVVAHFIC